MELSNMSIDIIKIINTEYKNYIDDSSMDIIYIKNICNLYENKPKHHKNIQLNEIIFTSPDFKKITDTKNKKYLEVIKSADFKKKYSFFIKIMHACLKIGVEIFDIGDDIAILKNNYQLIKALETRKRKVLADHIIVLKNQYKNTSQPVHESYDKYNEDCITIIKIIDKLIGFINKLVKTDIFDKSDNLLTLILPYFYIYTEFIEEYN